MKLCNYETAKALQELGYDGEYTEGYADDGTDAFGAWVSTPAPRLDDAAYWLRDKHKILISVEYLWYDGWQYCIVTDYDTHLQQHFFSLGLKSHDSALEAAVTEAIEIIQNKKSETQLR